MTIIKRALFERILIFSLLDYVQLRNREVDEEEDVPQPFDEEGPTKRFVKNIHRISCIDFRILYKRTSPKSSCLINKES